MGNKHFDMTTEPPLVEKGEVRQLLEMNNYELSGLEERGVKT